MMDKQKETPLCFKCKVENAVYDINKRLLKRCQPCLVEHTARISRLKNLDPIEVEKLYNSRIVTQEQLARELGVDKTGFQEFVRKHGITGRLPGTSYRPYPINVNYFKDIDTPNKAYFLGFLYADGCNQRIPSKNSYFVSVGVKKADIEILKKFAAELGTNKPIQFKKNCDFAYISMACAQISDDLLKHGCMPAKTFKIVFPEWLREDLIRHFIRGYFDGDGCISYNVDKKDRVSPVISMTSRKAFLHRIQQELHGKLDFKFNTIFPRKQFNPLTVYTHEFDISVITYGGRLQIEKFFNYIYDDAELFLQRKYDRMKLLLDSKTFSPIKEQLYAYHD